MVDVTAGPRSQEVPGQACGRLYSPRLARRERMRGEPKNGSLRELQPLRPGPSLPSVMVQPCPTAQAVASMEATQPGRPNPTL
jgi:hypothetical protein